AFLPRTPPGPSAAVPGTRRTAAPAPLPARDVAAADRGPFRGLAAAEAGLDSFLRFVAHGGLSTGCWDGERETGQGGQPRLQKRLARDAAACDNRLSSARLIRSAGMSRSPWPEDRPAMNATPSSQQDDSSRHERPTLPPAAHDVSEQP